MSCIVLDIELADRNGLKKLGVFKDGKVQGSLFCPPKKYLPTKQAFGEQKTWVTQNCVEQWTFGLQRAFKHSSRSCNG